MSDCATNSFLARVEVPAIGSLEECAGRLNRALEGVMLRSEDTFKCDEVPAYVERRSEVEFVLFGFSEDEPIVDGEGYVLEFTCRSQLPIALLAKSSEMPCLEKFVLNKPIDEHGFVNLSGELAHYLVSQGVAGCAPIRPIG